MATELLAFRSSHLQKHVWLHQQTRPPLVARLAAVIDGPADAAALKRSLETALERHEILRTHFRREEGLRTPLQVVGDAARLDWRAHDLVGATSAGQLAHVRGAFDAIGSEPFDLQDGSLVRAWLFDLAPEKTALVLCAPAICADAPTLHHLVAEMCRAGGGDVGVGEPVQYAQYTEFLYETEAAMPLPEAATADLDGGGAVDVPHASAHVACEIDGDLLAALLHDAAAIDDRVFACWRAYIARIRQAGEARVFAIVDGRKFDDLRGALGPFSRALALADDIDVNGTVRELFNRAPQGRADLRRDFEPLVVAATDAAPSAPPAIHFEFLDTPASLDEPALAATILEQDCWYGDCELKLVVRASRERLHIDLYYDPRRFTNEHARDLAAGFLTLLSGAVEAPGSRVGGLAVVGEAERARLVWGWNATQTGGGEGSVLAAVEAQARVTPEAVAVVEEGERAWTYGALEGWANQWAGWLAGQGVGLETRVGVRLPRSAELIAVLLGVWKAGGAYVPLEVSDPAARVAWMAEDAAVALLIAADDPALATTRAAVAAGARVGGWPARVATQLAYVMYTSGSTGRPKGVMVTEAGLANYVTWAVGAYGVTAAGGTLLHSPVSFDLTVTSLYPALVTGAPVHVVAGSEVTAVGEALRRVPPLSVLKITPAHVAVVGEQLGAQVAGRTGAVVIGGEALQGAQVAGWQRAAPATRLFNEYGPTETVVGCSVAEVEAGAAGAIAIGQPIANTQLYVVDGTGGLVPTGVRGEVWVGGAGVARGYWGQAALTAARFVPDAWSGRAGARVYRTGDLGRWTAAGRLTYGGRRDTQVKVRGYRVELGEIERVVAQQPAVAAAAVAAPVGVSGERQLVGYVVWRARPAAGVAAVQAAVALQLPAYMVPGVWVELAALPLTGNGKVDRAALPAAPAAGAGPAEAPRTVVEAVLAAIWSDVLQLPSVGLHDNFFQLGGDSILAIRVVARANQAGLRLTPQDLFDHQTVAALAPHSIVHGERVSGAPSKDAATSDAASDDRSYPLSPLQEGMLFDCLYDPQSDVYVEQLSCRVDGDLNTGAFRRIWEDVIARHAVLRTAFAWEQRSEPRQVVTPCVSVPWDEGDWQTWSADAQSNALTAYRASARRMALETAPLLRLGLHRVGPAQWQFTWTWHHLLLDGWSTAILLDEVLAGYEAYRAGREPKWTPRRPFADYIGWLQQQDLAAAEAYWRGALAGVMAPTELHLSDGAREPGQGGVDVTLSDADTRALSEAARTEHVTLNTMVQGAWALALSRYCGTHDVVYGTVVAGRPPELPGVEAMLGLFVNTLPARVRVDESARVGEWLRELQSQQIEARRYEFAPLTRVQSWSEIPRGTPLVTTVLAFENYPVGEALERSSWPGLRISRTEFKSERPFLLTASVNPGAQLRLRLSYDASRCDHAAVEGLLRHWRHALTAMASEPGARLRAVPLMDRAEQSRVVMLGRPSAAALPTGTLVEHFERQVAERPDAIAVLDDRESVTYAALNRRANQLARHLRAQGVGLEIPVMVCLAASARLVATLIAIVKAGGVYVPLDPACPEERAAFMIDDTQAMIVVTETALLDRVPVHYGLTVCLDTAAPELAAHSVDALDPLATPDSLAYVMYTSGSTGVPKGVAVPHHAIVRLVRDTNYIDLQPGNRIGQVADPSFDAATFEIWGAVLNGASVVMVSKDVALSPPALVDAIDRHRLDTLFLTTMLFNAVVRERPGAFSGCRQILFGGEAAQPKWVRHLLCHGAPQRLLNVYGPTENTTFSTWHEITSVAEEATTVPIGQAIANTQLYVLDGRGELAPAGVVGELYVGGAGVARGYVHRAALTASRFVPEGFSGERGTRLYRTGDRVRWRAEGTLEFVGRADAQVKIRGHRIEPGEVEAVLGAVAGVRDAVVVARTDGPEGNARLVAYWRPEEGGAVSAAALRAAVEGRLPRYMVPAVFQAVAAWPLTATGKLDRRALPAPDGERERAGDGYVAPRTVREAVLAQIWGEVLEVTRVGVTDNFFALGGDSILSIQVIARATRAGLRLTPRDVFEQPTVAGLAAVAGTGPELAGAQGVVTGPVALTPIQQWFFAQPLAARHHFNQSLLLRAREAVPVGAVAAALGAIVAHHDALRLRYEERGGRWTQENGGWPVGRPLLARIDLRRVPAARWRATVEAAAGAVQRSLRLGDGCLLRAAWLEGAGGEARLLVVIHHLGVDGVSWRILLEDLQTAVAAVRAGQVVELPAKTTSFQEWAGRVMAQAGSGALDDEVPYWTAAAAAGGLPPAEAAAAGGPVEVSVRLPEAETRALLQTLPQRQGAQMPEVLLTALATAVGEWTGTGVVRVEVEGHGRDEVVAGVDVTRTVGWFTSCYPLVLRTGGTVGATLAGVQAQWRGVPRRGVGYGLVRYGGGAAARAALAAGPAAAVGFNYLGQFDQALGQAGPWTVAAESAGPEHGPGPAAHALEVTGIVVNGRLHLQWSAAGGLYARATLDRVAARFVDVLRDLIATTHPDPGHAIASPSELEEFNWTSEDFDHITSVLQHLDAPHS